MKKKIIFGVLFSVLLAINIITVSKTNASDLTLTSLMQTAKASDGESGGMANKCCPIWTITLTITNVGGVPSTTIACTTGGEYQCYDCTCPTS
ncbi:MAG: hypothetical protein WC384_06295 [Prolixibacteraceae bacterium]|jgi:hypothetical protein